ncbi:MAG TPA: diguanylate cyclase [Pantanalinema sp.]
MEVMKTKVASNELRRTLIVNGLGPALVIVLLYVILIWQFAKVRSEADAVTHTVLVQEGVSQMDSLLANAAAGLHGYRLAGRPEFLRSFTQSQARVDAIAASIEDLVADNPSQSAAIRKIRSLVPHWYHNADLSMRVSSPSAATIRLMLSADGAPMLDEIHGRLRAMHDQEGHILRARQKRLGRSNSLAMTLGAVAILLVLGFFALFSLRQFRILNRHFQQNLRDLRRQKSELLEMTCSLAASNQLLERRVLERTEELQAASEKYRQLADSDGLSGIPNRRIFDEFLNREWSRCAHQGTPLSLIMLDIDFFKDFNDTYGHQAGDDCLRQVARALEGQARRPSDLVARYGGEEFGVILSDTDAAGAERIAERLREQIEGLAIPHAGSRNAPCVTMSLGVATLVPSPGTGPSQVVARADQALYQAKQEGRNRVCVLQPGGLSV